jgi:hypothetical protein
LDGQTNSTSKEATSRWGAGAVRLHVLPLSDDAWRTIQRRTCGTIEEYYDRFDDVAKRLSMLIETVTEGAVAVEDCKAESRYDRRCHWFRTIFSSRTTGDGGPRLTGEVSRIIGNLLAPFEEKLEQMNQANAFYLLPGNDAVILKSAVWFLPALIAYLELCQEQQRGPGAASGTSPYHPTPPGS